ncbi:M23 family metallopeptidase [Aquifex aeolicus]|uniref:M23ase beta-sheet core domain-containing protein n=1 Tax=Aquifex aeolicus (strain VF5) TaxID=224324 RepID=O67878_AQUAE|nr:M23 family metallopeptidase [Aquifex aeolicus]AAC07844.1 putative protein [Aquifex aeolicus VF5]
MIIVFLLFISLIFAYEPGSVYIFKFQEEGKYRVILKSNQEVYSFDCTGKICLWGVPLSLNGKNALLEVKRGSKIIFKKRIKISRKRFKVYTLRIRKRKLTPKLIRRIKKEREKILKVLKTPTIPGISRLELSKPLNKLVVTSEFGEIRLINGKRKSVHRGVDFRAKEGELVYAIMPGKVRLTGNFFFTGNTVIVEHGQGLYSLYAHLSEILVKEGQLVKAGELIGRAGSTGRSTGPHLHLGLYLNGIPFNPLSLLRLR